ncbi:hydroxysteroid dehydrogenase [Penicillium atrosanguineum]|uniref:Hydroxysteroid dehydrogenase n=1 Tax=Penicillium atrosanguineum TaxID=1132637 RepID=A0A9W9U8W0_9EURO|nr:High osmolarity signaling protein sho1 [Penicillium atrosanguineum]KAJ5149266.1 hydroxysteroid dehydrogenase [Penicillium atrosanguineum]KAJ5304579.1 High osmolarity signaling protein sho1 [Penicillium atrosanguineum]KAJ5324048.1 hydroxysteroid dehydrogenase [Penicillium atrosanguineum]
MALGIPASHVVDKYPGLEYLPRLNKYFEQKYGPGVIENVFVESFGKKDELDGIVDGVNGVVHIHPIWPSLVIQISSFPGESCSKCPRGCGREVRHQTSSLGSSFEYLNLMGSKPSKASLTWKIKMRILDTNSWNDRLLKQHGTSVFREKKRHSQSYADSKRWRQSGSCGHGYTHINLGLSSKLWCLASM